MGILLCILLVFLWADSSTLVNCVKMEQTAYETNRQNLVRADLANTIYEYSNGTSTRSFDAYVSSVISEAVAKMTQIGSTFIPYRRYDAIMEDQLKKLKVYELVSDIPKPVLLNAQFPLNMTPEEIFNALKGALGNTEVYEARLDNDHPIQLFLKEDSVKADTKNLDSLKADILKRLDFDDTYFLNPTPERYHKKVAEMLKYLEPLMKYDKVIEKMVMVNIESLINESVEYVEFRAFFPKQIYNLDTPRAAIKETFPQVVNRAVENYKIHSTKFVVKLIFLIDRGHKETMLEEYQRFVALLMQGQQVIGFDVVSVR